MGATTQSNSERIRTAIGFVLPELSDRGKQFWSHPRLHEMYPRYLVGIHTIIKASVPLMREALEVTRADPGGSELPARLAEYFEHHIPEEMHHDDWVLEDLELTGISRETCLSHTPSSSVAAMVGAQYYYIRHVEPAALLGYIAVLEGYPPSKDLARVAAEATGYPITAFRTLRKHANLDVHHRRDLDATLDSLPLPAGTLGLMCANAIQTTACLSSFMDELLSEHPASLLTSENQYK